MSAVLPREVAPVNVEVGDKIRVTLKPSRGVRTILEGVVDRRVDHGDVRTLYTKEGGALLAWTPGRTGVTVTLLDRPPAEQPTLFDIGDVRDRVA